MKQTSTNPKEGGIDRRSVLRTASAGIGAFALLSVSGVGAASHTKTVELIAAQNVTAGAVTVESDGSILTVTYDTSETDWELLGTHLHVADEAEAIPTNRKGNPKIGRFEYSGKPDPAPGEEAVYTVDISGLSGKVYIAAHAEVREVLIDAPYFAAGAAVEYSQGVKKNGNDIADDRSDPEAALVKAYPDGEFFSLGFMPDGEGGFEDEGGWIEITFDCPIVNGEGDDLRIWEVTFGDYPLESADVYAADANGEWVPLGEANNTDSGPQGTSGAHTISTFDLDSAGLDSTNSIRIVDTTDPTPHNGNADAFDIDGIQVLQKCTGDEETAWGAGEEFVDRGSWATYFMYDLGE